MAAISGVAEVITGEAVRVGNGVFCEVVGTGVDTVVTFLVGVFVG